MIGWAFARRPVGPDRAERAGGGCLVGGGDADERTLVDDDDARDRLGPAGIDRGQRGVDRRGAGGPCREASPARFTSELYWCRPVTKSRPSTLGTDWPATVHCCGGVVAASSPMTSMSFRPCVSSPKPSGLAGGAIGDLAVGDGDRGAVGRPAGGAEVDQRARAPRRPPCGAAGAMAGVVRLPNVPASKGTECGVAHDQADRFDRHAQLVGHGLGERGPDVLADLGLARVGGHRAVLGDVQPRADLARRRHHLRARGAACRPAPGRPAPRARPAGRGPPARRPAPGRSRGGSDSNHASPALVACSS